MSTYTTNLALFKYDINADAQEVFSIQNALNNNWDILDTQYLNLSNNCSQTTQNIITLSNGTIPLAEGSSMYYISVSQNTTFTFDVTNAPYSSSKAFTFELAIYMSTAHTLTFPSSVKWQDDIAPDMSQTGTYFFAFRRFRSSTKWRGSLQGVWQ